jgi:hypothetical protein
MGKVKEEPKKQIPIDLKVAIAWLEEQKKYTASAGTDK